MFKVSKFIFVDYPTTQKKHVAYVIVDPNVKTRNGQS